ncbi:MAG TPA: hypothetical protein PLC74_13565 [Acetobacteraceae bacterium]|nr:hypothetical protein [Acetobacteraceae bacterium]
MTQITGDLKLVVPIRDGFSAYHTPISREVYDHCFRVLRDAKVDLIGTSARHAFAARGDAALYLREAGRKLAADGGEDGGASALLVDLKRLTMVLVPTDQGFSTMPVDAAISAGKMKADEWSDVESSIVFFTCWLSGTPRKDIPTEANLAASLIGGSMTSLTAMEWAASLKTSTTATASTAPI